MARFCQALLFLVVTVALVSSSVQAWGTSNVVRPFVDISKNYVYVQQALWYAIQEYNMDSKDQYNFKVLEILKTQEQLTDSLEYYLEVKIARTQCKKISGDNANCLFQQDPKMKKDGDQIYVRLSSSPITGLFGVWTEFNSSLGEVQDSVLFWSYWLHRGGTTGTLVQYKTSVGHRSKPWKFELKLLKKQCKDI